MSAMSVTDINERETVEFLLSGFNAEFLAEPLGLDSWDARFLVPATAVGLPRRLGDIDALLVSDGRYELATAIQCKRVKFQAAAVTGRARPNKLGSLPKGVRQTKGTLEAGFHRAFLIVIGQVDARLPPGGKLAYPRPVGEAGQHDDPAVAAVPRPSPGGGRDLR